jgi:hypothetical protein
MLTFRCGPAADLAREIYTNDFGTLEFPRNISHDVDGISTTDTTGDHAETSSVRCVRVGTDHESSRERIIFEDDLMNDTGARFPEPKTVLLDCI